MSDWDNLIEVKISVDRALVYLARCQMPRGELSESLGLVRQRLDAALTEKKEHTSNRHEKKESQEGLF